ncbi:hypothetical protein [Burkholderia cepacia]|uniref:hypothetical protein n=1 Tax=Burkholderia cepacia TaxID=292 RepID=UPI001CF1A01E|nr:hypothetical protein [Burkholderia cepacia]MCA8355578.1 hypothetical protein [Burkholderia cepacia]
MKPTDRNSQAHVFPRESGSNRAASHDAIDYGMFALSDEEVAKIALAKSHEYFPDADGGLL